MSRKKLSNAEAAKNFDAARAHATKAKNDPNDPTSVNLLFALHEYFRSVGAATNELIDGLNDALDRLERIETKLGAQRR